jgi:hypothetical protein
MHDKPPATNCAATLSPCFVTTPPLRFSDDGTRTAATATFVAATTAGDAIGDLLSLLLIGTDIWTANNWMDGWMDDRWMGRTADGCCR